MAASIPHCSGLVIGLKRLTCNGRPAVLISRATSRRAASNRVQCGCAFNGVLSSAQQRTFGTPLRAASGVAGVSPHQEIPLSPAVRSLVEANHIDPSQIRGTGPKNRILKGDVLVFLQTAKTQPSIQLPTAPPKVFATPPPPSPVPGKIPAAPTLGKTPSAPLMGKPPAVRTSRYTDIPLGEARRNQASSVAQWKFSVPSCYASTECSVDALLQLKNSLQGEDVKVDMSVFFVKAVALTLERLPEANSIWDGTQPRRLSSVDISVVVETKDGPFPMLLKDVNTCSLVDISSMMQKLSEDGVNGTLTAEAQHGGSIDLSFLGPYGVREYTPCISPSHTTSLAIGALQMVPSLAGGGGVSRVVTATMAYDARVLDYEMACRWLEELKKTIESPAAQGLL
ncbi:hypothetical protein EMCRGX_G009572 [Ephydatia muelleri]